MTIDMAEAKALSHRRDIVDIYSNSWGVPNLGFIARKLRPMARRVFQKGTSEVSDGSVKGFCTKFHNLYRDGMEKGQFSYFQMVMEVQMMTVLLVAIHPVYTPSLLGLWDLIAILVLMMKSALQKWSLHT